jgi:hypothetical protein
MWNFFLNRGDLAHAMVEVDDPIARMIGNSRVFSH